MGRSKKDGAQRDELIRALFLFLLFIVVIVGRELGSIYGSYGEISELSVLFQVPEEELVDCFEGVLRGEESDLEVGIALTLPSVRNVEGIVTEVPDYVRRWMIGVAVSPIVVRQPEVSDVEVRMLVEGKEVHFQRFQFEKEKVPYITLLKRSFSLGIEDLEGFRGEIEEAADRYGGEVEVTFEGRALLHILFLKDWLPFSTTRYPLVRIPHADLESSKWVDSDGDLKARTQTNQTVFIQINVINPTRVHSLHDNVTIAVFKEGSEEPVHTSWKIASVAPGTKATYVFPFTPEEAGEYRYFLEANDNLKLAADNSPTLHVDDG